MQDKKQTYLEKQLYAYEQKTNMTESERRALHKWVKAGHSVYEAPGSLYHCDGEEEDFLDVYREDKEIGKILEGKSDSEKADWLREYYGYDTGEKEEPTYDELKARIRDLKRELFHLWDFVNQKGLSVLAEQYVESNKDDPIPFETE